MVVPLYIAESAPPQIRGRLTTVFQLMITFGIFIAHCINATIFVSVDKESSTMWRLALGMQMLPAVFLVIAVCFIPLSPRWLAEKDRHDEGIAVIAKLRSKDVNNADVIAEYDSIRQSIEMERRVGNASWVELFTPGVARRVAIAIVNQAFQQYTGINVILQYSNTVFKNIGFDNVDTDFSSVVTFPVANAFINFVATFPGMWAVERFGRRPLLILGGALMGLAHALVYGFITAASNGTKSMSWGAVFAIYLFFFAFASTWGPVVWAYQSEIFPLRVRAKGTGVGTMSNWTFNTIVGYTFPIMFKALNKQPVVYWVYAASCIASAVWAFVAVPETKGKTLEDMDEIFGAPRRDTAEGAIEVGQEKK
ncbi:High-affinity glucose transporter rgt2 [Phlyctochytrium bullatum]|nr:High-affinity glucose transporter rgt2 [Phlyctochytrium bullatum]